MAKTLGPDDARERGLWAYCPECKLEQLVSINQWEPDMDAFLCFQTLPKPIVDGRWWFCQTPLLVLPQKVADAAQALGGRPALAALGEALWQKKQKKKSGAKRTS